jgi:hypothetical protein
MRRLFCSALIATLACTPMTSSPTTEHHASYKYILTVPTGPLAPGEIVSLDWVPRLSSSSASGVYDVELCVGLFGPWNSVDALKSQSHPDAKPACPPAGAKVADNTTRTRSNAGAQLRTAIMAPSVPGFYDLRQIVLIGDHASVGASVVEIRAR